jgi:hypothetical protein
MREPEGRCDFCLYRRVERSYDHWRLDDARANPETSRFCRITRSGVRGRVARGEKCRCGRALRGELTLLGSLPVTHQERQTEPIHLLQMCPAVVLRAVLTICQSADDRYLLTAVLAIHDLYGLHLGRQCPETALQRK